MDIDMGKYAAICGVLVLMLIIGGAVGWHLGMVSAIVMRLYTIERLLLHADTPHEKDNIMKVPNNVLNTDRYSEFREALIELCAKYHYGINRLDISEPIGVSDDAEIDVQFVQLRIPMAKTLPE